MECGALFGRSKIWPASKERYTELDGCQQPVLDINPLNLIKEFI
jgi:hypothetical protein